MGETMGDKIATIPNMIMALLTMVVSWMAWTVQDSTVKLATLSEKVSTLESSTQLDRTHTYTLRDAQKDFELRDTVMSNMATRLTRLEKEN
jgi:hypothetical protein